MRQHFANLSLFWKLLVPFTTVILVVGAFGAFVLVRDLSSRAQHDLSQDLLQSSLEAQSHVKQREVYLLDAANLASNLEGMAGATAAGDAAKVSELLENVVVLRSDLDLIAVIDRSVASLAERGRSSLDEALHERVGNRWDPVPLVQETLAEPGALRHSGLVDVGGEHYVAMAAPICSRVEPCSSTGVAVVGFRVARLVAEIESSAGAPSERRFDVALFDPAGGVLGGGATTDRGPTDVRPRGRELIERAESAGGIDVHTMYSVLELQDRAIGIVGVSQPSEPVFAPVRSAGLRLTFLLLAALLCIAGLGAAISRHILRQVTALVDANRALASGDFGARAPVLSGDEIGEVARGLNLMAEHLQASHATLESRVSQRTEEVQRLLEERTEFFASLSHELRTPIAVILNEVDALLEHPRMKSSESARAIKLSGAQLLTVVNEILDVAKGEAGHLEVAPITLSLRDAVGVLLPTVRGLARAADVKLDVRVGPNLPDVAADPQRLREILLNLVDNAVQHTPAGGQISISAEAADEFVEVHVSDTGRGIPGTVGERVFEPFYTVKESSASRRGPSSGLGLALTRRLVEAHGGSIRYTSNPGQGTTFSFSLPVAQAGSESLDDALVGNIATDRE